MTKLDTLSSSSIAADESLHHIGHNYYLVRRSGENDRRDKINPVTGQKYTSADLLSLASSLFKGLDHRKLSDLTPVDTDEAVTIMDQYYTDMYGPREGLKREATDVRRRRGTPLVPGSASSGLFRPKYSRKGRLQRSGPESFDMKGVDDGSKAAVTRLTRKKKTAGKKSKKGRR